MSTLHDPHPRTGSHRFSWQAIWAFFMRLPHVRNWLFRSQPPPSSEIVASLLSSPLLVGYVFGDVHASSRGQNSQHLYPDIGDLICPHHRSGDAIFAFHYGYQNIQPLVPMLYQISGDPLLHDPKVSVRRSVKQRVSFADGDYFLAIELDWLQSGVLHVSTNVHPIASPLPGAQSPAPFVNYITHKTFAPTTAERFILIQQRHAMDQEMQSTSLPADFLDPPDGCYIYSTFEPIDSLLYQASAQPLSQPCSQAQSTEQQFQQPSDTSRATRTSKRPRASSNRLPVPGHEAGAITLWNDFSQLTTSSRRNGIFYARLYKRFGGRVAQSEVLARPTVRYTFLSTTGLNTGRRIQHLSSQLGIDGSSPLIDRPFRQFFEDDLIEESQSIFEPNSQYLLFEPDGQSLQLFDASIASEPTLLSENEDSNAIPFCDEADFLLPDTYNPVAVNPNPPAHATTEPASLSDSQESESTSQGDETETETTTLPTSNHPTPNTSAQRHAQARSPKRHRLAPSAPPEDVPSIPIPRTHAHAHTLQTPPAAAAASGRGMAGRVAGWVAATSAGVGGDAGRERGGVSAGAEGAGVRDGCATDRSGTVWMCDRCGALIRGKRGNLMRHIAHTHDNIRNFACTETGCERRFQTRPNLARHVAEVHRGRPFACRVCPRTFKTPMAAAAHARQAHQDAATATALACAVCRRCYSRRSTLKRHMLRVHAVRLDAGAGAGGG